MLSHMYELIHFQIKNLLEIHDKLEEKKVLLADRNETNKRRHKIT